jgi:hypothetical protein
MALLTAQEIGGGGTFVIFVFLLLSCNYEDR